MRLPCLTGSVRIMKGTAFYTELLTYELYLRENVKNRPAFAGSPSVTKEEETAFYRQEAAEHRYLLGYEQYDKRQLRKMTHLERVNGEILLTNQAAMYRVSLPSRF